MKMTMILFYGIIFISMLKKSSCFNDYFASFDILTFSGNNVNFTKNNEILQTFKIKEYQNIRSSIYDEDSNIMMLCGNTLNGEVLISKLDFFTNNSYRFESIFSESFIQEMAYHSRNKELYWFNESNVKVMDLRKVENNVQVLNISDVLNLKVDTTRNYLYWIEKTSMRKIKRINLNRIEENEIENFYSSNFIISSIDFDYQSHYLYWLEKNSLHFYLNRFDLVMNQNSSFLYSEINISPTNLNVINENQFYWINNHNLHNITHQENSFDKNTLIFNNISGFSVKKRILFDQIKFDKQNSIVCDKKCQNNGQCVIVQNNSSDYVLQSCKCKDLFFGDLCELKFDSFNLCSVLCNLQLVDINELHLFCNCKRNDTIFNTFLNRTIEVLKDVLLNNDISSLYVPSHYDYYYTDKIITTLSLLIAALFLIIMLLLIKIFCIKNNTKVRKRYLINKNYNKFPERQTEHCEIEIENCCNMNICETPCFEPVQLKSVNSARKVEDKKKLISHMENNEVS